MMKQAIYSLLLFFCISVSAEKKNVLFIIADDLNTWQGCYGSFVKTPNIDKLAAKGMLFEKAYCQFPVCGPSRISMMSGMYASRLGATGNHFKLREKWPDIKVLPQVFRENGYWTGRVSKIYHMVNHSTQRLQKEIQISKRVTELGILNLEQGIHEIAFYVPDLPKKTKLPTILSIILTKN